MCATETENSKSEDFSRSQGLFSRCVSVFSTNYIKTFLAFMLSISCLSNAASDNKMPYDIFDPNFAQEKKINVVVAMPFQPGLPYDPSWYSPEYVNYLARLLPSEQYCLTGYLVCLENISQFIDDMAKLHARNVSFRVLNFCDGGEWDGYPGISVTKKWEEHPVSKHVGMSGADAQFLYNSDDKIRMNEFLKQAKLRTLPQAIVPAHMEKAEELQNFLVKEELDCQWPLFLKLNIGGGAIGIYADSVCHNMDELVRKIKTLHKDFPDSAILAQPYLVGPEYTVLVLMDRVYATVRRDFHNPENLMLEDYLTGVRPVEQEISYHPAPAHVNELTINAIKAIPGKPHYTRVDLRDDAKGNTYVLDINDRPGFGAPGTVYCMLGYHRLSETQLLIDIINAIGQ